MRTRSRSTLSSSSRPSLHIDKHIEQLPHQHLFLFNERSARSDGIDELHHAGVDLLDVDAGERGLRDDIGLNAYELQRYFPLLEVSTQLGASGSAELQPRNVFLIDAHAHVQWRQVAHQDQRLNVTGRDKFARPYIDLQDRTRHRRSDLE